ncbi:MAG: hypothetical protein U9O94_10810 [Nanoarchaeota archaeon]|nr:hypothetical protein [Nanoarchaeota archaeon]
MENKKTKVNVEEQFVKYVKKYFNFLITEYESKLIKIKEDVFGTYIYYQNNEIGISINFTPGGIWVEIHELKNNSIPLISGETGVTYGLNYIIQAKNPSHEEYSPDGKELIKDHHLVEKVVVYLANNLKKYATDILQGNSPVFKAANQLRLKKIKSIDNKFLKDLKTK